MIADRSVKHVLVVLAAISCGSAADAAPTIMAGAGAHTCAQFAEFYKQSPQLAEEDFFSWALGFMSAANIIGLANKEANTNKLVRDLSSMDNPEKKSLIRQYCNDHPLVSYSHAVVDLLEKLRPVTMPTR
jgi:hypothetical protein